MTDANREGGATLAEPVKRYTRVVDRLECPVCGKRLGKRHWNYLTGWNEVAYVDVGPTYHLDTVIEPKKRVFKPCGCEVTEAMPNGS